MSDKLRKAYRFASVPEHLIKDKGISDRAVRLWCLLDRYAGKDDSAFPSRETLSNDLSCSRASVDRAVGELVKSGWLNKRPREAGGVNEYTLLIAPVRSGKAKAQVRPQGVITGDDTPPSSPVMTPPVLTGDDTPAAPVTTPVITGAAQKEASLNEHQLTESSDDSLRSSSAADQPHLVDVSDGASSTPTIGEEKPEHAGDPVAAWWWNSLDPKPIKTSKREQPFIHIRNICRGALEAGWTQRQVADALVSIRKPLPTKGELDQRLRELRDGSGQFPSRRLNNVHQMDPSHPDAQRRRALLG